MTSNSPTRLTKAEIRLSQCPICRYSLKGLASDVPCPECGVEIDRDLITSPEMEDSVAATKAWCIFGAVGWALFAFAYWVFSMITLLVMNGYFPGKYGMHHFAGVWLRTAFVVAPLALSWSWFRQSRRNIYRNAMKRNQRIVKIPKRVYLMNMPGILLGLLGCALIMMMISAA